MSGSFQCHDKNRGRFRLSRINGTEGSSPDLFQRTVKAAIITLIVSIILLVIWVFLSQIFGGFPQFQNLFAVLAGGIIFFTFAIRFSEGTIFKYGFIIGRAFFFIVFSVYATNGGVLTADLSEFHFMVEFVPILALIVVINLLEVAKGVLQIIEFTSEVPPD